jgi:hypothetical protein
MSEGNAGHNTFAFTVSLDRAQPAPVTVDFSTADGTATAPSDYVAEGGTVTFAPGETQEALVVRVNGDTTVEPNETFTVNLADAVGNATIADGQGVGTIVNDDRPVTEQPARISVTLDRSETAPVSVPFSTANGTARAPGDYSRTRGTITFAPGETTKTITVFVKGDTTKESNETFRVNLGRAAGNATIGHPRAVGTIVNDDRRARKAS